MTINIPKNSELFGQWRDLLSKIVKPQALVVESPFASLAPNSKEIDIAQAKALFADIFLGTDAGNGGGLACHSKGATDHYTHHALRDIGSASFYGKEGDFDPQSALIGPVWFGKNVKIRMSAKVVGPSLIDDDVFLNTAASVTRSMIGAKTQVEERVTIKDAVIGSKVFIGAGACISSRSEEDPWHEETVKVSLITKMSCVKAKSDQEYIDTGRHKLGPIIGDSCRIGANAVLKPGVILYPGCMVEAGKVLPAGIYQNTAAVKLM